MHCYLADGHWESWLANIERLRAELPGDATLHVGHGEPATPELLDWQRGYIERFVAAVRAADWSDDERAQGEVVAAMREYLPSEDLLFLMELSVEPVAAELGLLEAPPG
jgi:glyoxylase-like metal-dependent hydrolase (beta-lactamase superfamily II)